MEYETLQCLLQERRSQTSSGKETHLTSREDKTLKGS